MKKFLAILMTLAMLVSSCAFAEATEPLSTKIVLDDFVLYEGPYANADNVLIDLSGLGLSLSAYDGEIPSLQLALTASDEDVAGLSVAVDETKLLLGMTGVSNTYSVDIMDVVELFASEIGLISDPETEDMAAIISEEDQMALAELVAEGIAMYEASGETSTEEIDGAVYDITNNYISLDYNDDLMVKAIAILDHYPQLVEGSGFESFAEVYETIAPSPFFYVTTYTSENEFIFKTALMSLLFSGSDDEQGVNLEITAKSVLSDESTVDTQVEVLAAHNEAEYTLTFNMKFVDNNDSSWVPASDAAIDLFEALADEAQFDLLMTEIVANTTVALTAIVEANAPLAALVESLSAAE